ncbi:MAG: carboxypeptidase regulatory-like domain-containing protein [Acidobacteriia bacterium]|nr:carboxypeptidase regulatory-like domain-containing protein [Terriglobia bacterium]
MQADGADMRTRVLAASILASAGLVCAQPGGQSAGPARPAETVELRGRVLSGRRGVPVRGAKVAVTARERENVSAFTRFNGSFVIENAPVGDYEIGVAASGYELWQKRIRIPSGRPLDGLDLRINRSAVITGRVLDEDGRAVVGATVEALREQFLEGRLRWRDQSSRMTRFQGGFRTDDRGVYRIFGLSAGEYVIAVRPTEEPGLDGQLRFDTAPGYFPNAGSLSGAARVEVDWGEEKQGIDVRLVKAPPTSAHGRVSSPDARISCSPCRFEVYRWDGSAVRMVGSRSTTEQGSFSLFGLPPGQYVAVARLYDRRAGSQAFGRQPFAVSEGRVEAVEVEALAERDIVGRLVLVDPPDSVGDESGAWSSRIRLEADNLDPTETRPIRGMFAKVEGMGGEGPFELTAVPGRYRLIAFGPKGAYVEGIEIDGRPVPGSKLTVPRNGISGDVVVTMSFATGTVRGTVRELEDGESTGALLGKGGLLPPASTVRLLPAGEGPPAHPRLYGRVREGGFEITAVPPGEYEAFAFPDRAGYSIEDPRYRKKLARYGGKVEVKSGETAVLDLQALPTREQFGQEGLR